MMTNPPVPPAPSVLAPPMTMTVTRTPDPPAPDPPSLVQRITSLEDQLTRVFAMMARDREYMDELRARIGLS